MNELREVMTWEQLGQWCWVRMLDLNRAWRPVLSSCKELPSAELEQSIDTSLRSMLRSPADLLVASEEEKPWILARLRFCSGLLQPRNLRLLKMPKLVDAEDALWFLLLTEWYESGRESWFLVWDVMNDPDNNASSSEGLLFREVSCH